MSAIRKIALAGLAFLGACNSQPETPAKTPAQLEAEAETANLARDQKAGETVECKITPEGGRETIFISGADRSISSTLNDAADLAGARATGKCTLNGEEVIIDLSTSKYASAIAIRHQLGRFTVKK